MPHRNSQHEDPRVCPISIVPLRVVLLGFRIRPLLDVQARISSLGDPGAAMVFRRSEVARTPFASQAEP